MQTFFSIKTKLLFFNETCFINERSLFDEWTAELKAMADRIISMRQKLFDALRSRGQCFPIKTLDLFG